MTRTDMTLKHGAPSRMALALASLLVLGSVGIAHANGGGQSLEGKTLLAIFAHPDDEITGAPLLARYAREGATVKLAIVTDGGAIRDAEALCSTQELGIDPPILMGFEDGATPEDARQVKGAIAALFVEVQPDIVVTWGPEGGYGHKDHRMVSAIVADVFQAGGDGVPDAVYFPGIPHFQIEAFSPTSPQGLGFKFVWGRTDLDYLQYRIAFSDDDLDASVAAAACHVSQFSPEFVLDVENFFVSGDYTIFLRKSHHELGDKLKERTSLFGKGPGGDEDEQD